MNNLSFSEKGALLLKCLETEHRAGVPYPRLKAYLCSAHKWTIGYGTTVYPDNTAVKEGDVCTAEQAESWFWDFIRNLEKEIKPMIHVNLTQCQYDALVIFAYNVGAPRFKTSTLLRVLNEHDTTIPIDQAFLMWNKQDGSHDGIDNDGDGLIDEEGEKKRSVGLENRRRSEIYFFLNNEIKFFS